MPGARWHRTLIGLLAAALLLASAAPATARQADRSAGEARPPEDLWTSAQHDRAGAGAMAAPSSEEGWPLPVLLLALAGAYAAGFVATYAPGLLTDAEAPPDDRPSAPEPPPPEPPPATVTQTCTIALADGAFQVLVRDARGRRRVACRSETFDAAPDPLPQAGAAAEIHRRLLDRLRAVGWAPEPVPGGAWYETRLVRAQAERGRPPRVALVEARRAPGKAWFAAVALSGHARATPLGESPSFSPEGGDELEPDAGAAAAHAALLAELEQKGWEVVGAQGPWYASTLRRRGASARS